MKGRTGGFTRLHQSLFLVSRYNRETMKTYKSILKFSISDDAQFRLAVIKFFEEFGLKPTQKAYRVSKATVYRWRKKLKDSEGKLETLIPQSRAPKGQRKMLTDPQVIGFIRRLREEHPRLGKRKIKPLLDQYCQENGLTTIALSTIGKVIKRFNLFFTPSDRVYHNPNSAWNRRKKSPRKRIKHSPKPEDFGYLQIDTVAQFLQGMKFYVYNALDIKLRFSYSRAYKRLNSQNTVDFFKKLEKVYPLRGGIKTIQTDNGLEFLGEFSKYLKKKGLNHLFIYPRCPRINAYVERANRTLREEFLNHHLDLALINLDLLNQKMTDYLLWYNTKKPHESLNDQSPIDYLLKVAPESQKYVTCTSGCGFSLIMI